jgi:hypothetical protein
MTRQGRWALRVGTTIGGTVLLFLAAVVDLGCKEKPAPLPAPPPATRPATTTTTSAPSTRASTQPAEPRTFVDLVKRYYPDCPATQPLDSPLDRGQGARVRVPDPIYLDRLQNLWITRADAEPTEKVLSKVATQTEHLLHEKPVYAHWRYEDGTKRKEGHSTVTLVCPAADGKTIEFIEESGRAKLTAKSTDYYWPDAFTWNQKIVVGHATGASVFIHGDSGWEELSSPNLANGNAHARTQIPVELDGVLAYIPVEAGHEGSKNVARFTAGKWQFVQDKEWPGNFLHLVPLADGSVLQIIADPPAKDHDDENLLRPPKVHLAITSPSNTTQVDQKQVLGLIDQLDSRDAEARKTAFQQLAIYGSSLWPIIEKEMLKRPDGVKEKLAELLKNKTEPTLGEMSLVDPRLTLAARTADGGALFYDAGGVSVTNVDGDQTLVSPAWISVLPGQPIHLMIGDAWANLTPEHKTFYSLGGADWIVGDEAKGPEEIVGTFNLQPILKKSEAKYSEFVGVDRRGRWLFRKPGVEGSDTLLLDPTLPPITPRLPVWEFSAGKEAVIGWDENDWPSYKDKSDNVWIIDEYGFHVQDKKVGKFLSEPSDVPKLRAPHAATRPATTTAASQPTSHPYVEAAPPLLVQADGTCYYGGLTDLRRVAADGTITDWPLPPECRGSFTRPWLVADKDGRLFLFNEPGRIVRIRTNPPAATQPFKVDATFAHKIPNDEPMRMWLDPADRMIILHDGTMATISFPAGVVPSTLADKIPGDAKDAAEEEDEEAK